MAKIASLVCVKCGRRSDEEALVCPRCGLEGILDVEYDYSQLRNSLQDHPLKSRDERSIARYADLLPGRGPDPDLRTVGWTPLYTFRHLDEVLGLDNVHIKDETVNPSGSLKDRASAVAVSLALESENPGIACASTGNAGSSLAVLAASVGLDSYIFVPERIPAPKLYQIGACARRVFRVKGTYEDAFELATKAIERWGWYNRNCAINPYLVEGKKTCALEVYEQLNYTVPDWLVVPVGDGCVLSGQHKAFKELKILGQTTRLPKMLAVQASGCKPVVDAFLGSGDGYCASPSTIADSIRVGKPRNWRKAVRCIRESGGAAVSVSDGEIVEAMLLLGHKTGIFAEPAAAAGLAGLKKAVEMDLVRKEELSVVIVTGSGLKDPESLATHVEVVDVEANVDLLAKCL